MATVLSVATFAAAIRMAVCVGFACLGTVLVTKSGVMHMGQEGMMLICSFVAVAATFFSENMFIGLFASMGAGVLISLIYGYFAITHKGTQVVIGVGTNFLGLGLTAVGITALWNLQGSTPGIEGFKAIQIPVICNIPIIGDILNSQTILFYVLLLCCLLMWIVFYKTPFGLRLRIAGELPLALECTGHSVILTRYICMAVSGLLFGLSGVSLTMAQVNSFSRNMNSGRGYVSLAMCVLGRYSPGAALLCCLAFGFVDALQIRLQGGAIAPQLFQMLPYLFTIVVICVSGNLRVPSAMNKPYPEEHDA